MAQTHSLDLERSSTQYASIADASQTGLDAAGSFTLEAWFKLESLPGSGEYYWIVGKGGERVAETDSTLQYALWYDNDTARRLIFAIRQSGVGKYAIATITLEVGVWYHIAGTFEASTAVRLWLNGRNIASETSSIAASTVNTGRPFAVGVDLADATPGNLFDGAIKDVRMFNDLRTQAEIISDARAETVVDGNLVGQWNFNGVATDSSGNGNTLTLTNSPVYSVDIPWAAVTSVQSSGYVLDLEASSSQYAAIADGSQTGLDVAGDMTLEAWICPETLPTSGNIVALITKWNSGGTNQRAYGLWIENSAGTYRFLYITSTNGTASVSATANYAFPIGRWTHVAVSKTGSTATFYVNGVSIGTAAASASQFNSTAGVGVGARNDVATYIDFFDGQMRDVRIFDDARTQAEVVADALTRTVSDANLKAEWALNNAYTDASGNGNTLTASGSPVFKQWMNLVAGGLISYWALNEASGTRADSHSSNNLTDNNTVSSSAGKKSLAADFESSSSEYLNIADGSQTGLDITGDFSIAGWINIESLPGSGADAYWMSKFNNGASQRAYAAGMTNVAGTMKLRFLTSSTGSNQSVHDITYALTTATWYHIVFSYKASTGIVQMYVNGVHLGEVSGGFSSIFNSSAAFTLGAFSDPDNYYDGLLDEASIYYRPIDYGDVLDLYNGGSAISYAVEAVAATGDNFMMGANF